MTVFEYMQQLPQPLFETDAVISADAINMPPTDELLALLGREIQKLSPEQQEQMRNAMKNYCEVCDCINQNLADAQKE